jgi:hypothetical protein
MRRDGVREHQFLIKRKKNIFAWRAGQGDGIERLGEMSFLAQADSQRRGLGAP